MGNIFQIILVLLLGTALFFFGFGVGKKQQNTIATETPKLRFAVSTPTTASLPASGEVLYQANCTFCHSYNASVDGHIGPAITGTSFEVLEAKLHRATYPKGYIPKRTTLLMPTFPQFSQAELEAIYLYLNQSNR